MFGNYFILTIICFLTILTILSLVSGWELSEIGDTFWFLTSTIPSGSKIVDFMLMCQNCDQLSSYI